VNPGREGSSLSKDQVEHPAAANMLAPERPPASITIAPPPAESARFAVLVPRDAFAPPVCAVQATAHTPAVLQQILAVTTGFFQRVAEYRHPVELAFFVNGLSDGEDGGSRIGCWDVRRNWNRMTANLKRITDWPPRIADDIAEDSRENRCLIREFRDHKYEKGSRIYALVFTRQHVKSRPNIWANVFNR